MLLEEELRGTLLGLASPAEPAPAPAAPMAAPTPAAAAAALPAVATATGTATMPAAEPPVAPVEEPVNNAPNNNEIQLVVTLEVHSIELLDSSDDEDWPWVLDMEDNDGNMYDYGYL